MTCISVFFSVRFVIAGLRFGESLKSFKSRTIIMRRKSYKWKTHTHRHTYTFVSVWYMYWCSFCCRLSLVEFVSIRFTSTLFRSLFIDDFGIFFIVVFISSSSSSSSDLWGMRICLESKVVGLFFLLRGRVGRRKGKGCFLFCYSKNVSIGWRAREENVEESTYPNARKSLKQTI